MRSEHLFFSMRLFFVSPEESPASSDFLLSAKSSEEPKTTDQDIDKGKLLNFGFVGKKCAKSEDTYIHLLLEGHRRRCCLPNQCQQVETAAHQLVELPSRLGSLDFGI